MLKKNLQVKQTVQIMSSFFFREFQLIIVLFLIRYSWAEAQDLFL